MNDVLQLMRADFYEMKSNTDIVEFIWSWIATLTTDFPIYWVEWFYVKPWTCVESKLFYPLDESCWFYCWSNLWYKWLYMNNVWAWYKELESCQYSYCPDTKEIKINIPDWVTEWYIKYFKWFDLITSQSDCLPIQPSWFPAIKMLMKVYYYEKAWTVYEWEDNKFETKYEKFLQKMKDRDAIKVRFFKSKQAL